MTVLYSNRASCHQNICDYKSCIDDCNKGLELVSKLAQDENLLSTKLKLKYKKAHALEMNEKYEEAFIEYEGLMKLDSRFKNVQLNYNRVRNLLNQSGKLNKIRSNMNTKTPTLDQPLNAIRTSSSFNDESSWSNKQKMYEEFKLKGNEHIKLNNFEKASEFYTKCIQLDATNTIAYLNRSLCYIKMNKPTQAIQDASFVIENNPSNVKALYRRSLANKLVKNYNQCVTDLNKLLDIEVNNQIAKQELIEIRELIKKQNLTKIEEVEAIQISNISTLSMSKKPSNKFEPAKVIVQKVYNFSSITNAYEFLQSWNSISPNEFDIYADLLLNVEPFNLPKFIGSKLDDDMFNKLIRSLKVLNIKQTIADKQKRLIDYLKSITNVQRFNIIKLFINKELKEIILDILSQFNQTDSDLIKKLYGI